LGFATPASALTLSSFSSDLTPASSLDATLDFSVIGGNELQLVLSNTTSAPNEFNINEVFFNGSADVTSLALTSADHSVEGILTIEWEPVIFDEMVNGFGMFDFGMKDGVGENDPSVVGPTESITFLFDITGVCADSFSCTAADFLQANGGGFLAAAKFVSGPDDPEAPGNTDSAFGAVPEPTTGLLLGLGVLLVLVRDRRNR
jgi:hypothetical protein